MTMRPIIEPSRRMQAPQYPWDHEVQIALPPRYHGSDQGYPVLWVTDGSELFETAVSIVNGFAKPYLPDMIVVGVGTPPTASHEHLMRRMHDFTTPEGWAFDGFGAAIFAAEVETFHQSTEAAGMMPALLHGGAPKFLNFLVDHVRSDLAGHYRFNGDHILFGDSAGGIFCAYAVLARHQAFSKYICGSPGLRWGDYAVFRQEEDFARSHDDLPVRLFLGAGEREIVEPGMQAAHGMVSSMARFAEILSMRRYPSLDLKLKIFPGEGHASVIPLNLQWGLRAFYELRS